MLKIKKLEDALGFLTLLFLPTQLGKHFWPDFSYIYSLKIDYLSPVLYFWDLLATGLLIVWLLQKPKINKTALILFLFFLLTQSLSLIEAQNLGAGLVRLEQFLVSGFFGIFLASQKWGNLSKKIYLPLALAIFAEGALAILQFSAGKTLGLWVLGERNFNISTPGIAKFDFLGSVFLRPYATFPHPNVMSGFILVGLASMYYLPSLSLKAFKLVNVFAYLAIFLSMSRVAIFAASLTLFSVARRKLLWVVAALLVASPVLFIRFSSLVNFDYLTLLRRGELMENSLKIFISHPLFGVGLNNFIPALAGNLLTGPSRFLQPVHNIVFLTLAETGMVGFLGFLLLVGYPIVKSLKFKVQSSKLLLTWFIVLFLGMFDHYFLTLPQGYRMLFLVWGLSLSRASFKRHGKS